MSLVIPNTFSSGATLDPAEVNQNFTAVANKMGAITNEDIAAGAAISVDKLSAQYERLCLNVRVPSYHLQGVDRYFYLPFLANASPVWAVDGITMTVYNSNTNVLATMSGTKTGVVQWGEITTASGAFTSATTIVSAEDLTGVYAKKMTLANTALGAIGGAATEIPAFRFYLSGFATAAADIELYLSIVLKRKIQAS